MRFEIWRVFFTVMLFQASLLLAQQPDLLTIKVVDSNDEKLLTAATVLINGELSKAVISGLFSYPATDGLLKVRVSHAGYATIDTLLNSSKAHVLFMKATILSIEEVIVNTGYQKVSQERTVGSYQVVDKQLLGRSVSTDLLSRLKNIGNSVFFPDSYSSSSYNEERKMLPSINVRGIATLRSTAQSPLIILDNFPYEGDLIDINPNDIQNVTILKDAAATSMWGAKAANGVIVVTTKDGSETSQATIDLSTNVVVTGKPNLMNDRSIRAQDYLDFEQTIFEAGYFSNIESSRAKTALSPWVEALIKKRDGYWDNTRLNEFKKDLINRDVRLDYLRYIYQKPVMQQYGLAISDRGAKSNYRLSLGYDENKYSLEQNRFKRGTLRLDHSLRISTRLTLQTRVGLNFNTRHMISPQRDFAYGLLKVGGRTLYPYASLVDKEGRPSNMIKDYRTSFVQSVQNEGLLLDWNYNPIAESHLLPLLQKRYNALVGTSINYKLSGGLTLEGHYQIQQGNQYERDLNDLDSYYTRNLINRYTQIINNKANYILPNGAILQKADQKSLSHQFRFQTNYSRKFKNHQIDLLMGMEIRQANSASNSRLMYGFDDNSLAFINAIDFKSRYSIYADLASDMSIPNPMSFSDLTDRFVSYYGNFTYGFRQWGQLYASARKDASNLFGVETNRKWTPLWSLGGALNIVELLKKPILWLDYLKLKGSYGYSGIAPSGIAAMTVVSMYPNNSQYAVDLPYAYIDNPPNENLRWEKAGMLNIGVEFLLWNKNITGSIEWFKRRTKDLLVSVPIDLTSGMGITTKNSGETLTQGLDLMLSTKKSIGKVLFSSILQGTITKNTIKEYYFNYTAASAYMGSGIIPVEGYQAYPVFSYQWRGLDSETGNPIGVFKGEDSQSYTDIVRNSKLEDLVYHGSSRPRVFGSWINSVSYGSLTVSANIGFYLDYYFRRNSIQYASLVNSGGGHEDYALRWQKTGDELYTNVPSFLYPIISNREQFYTNSSVLVERGDHIRINDIRIEMNIDKWFGWRYTTSLTFGVNNVGIVWRKNNYNIDPQSSGVVNEPKSFLLGLRFKI